MTNKPQTLAAVLADPHSNLNRILAAHKAAGGNFNPYRTVNDKLVDCSDKGKR